MRSLLVVEAMVSCIIQIADRPSEAISSPIDSAHFICNRAMSEKGDCWDNAVAKSFFSTLGKTNEAAAARARAKKIQDRIDRKSGK